MAKIAINRREGPQAQLDLLELRIYVLIASRSRVTIKAMLNILIVLSLIIIFLIAHNVLQLHFRAAFSNITL